MTVTKKRAPLPSNQKRAASCGEAARLQKQKKWKEVVKRPRKF